MIRILLKDFWKDEAGYIVTSELVVLSTVGIVGTAAGMSYINQDGDGQSRRANRESREGDRNERRRSVQRREAEGRENERESSSRSVNREMRDVGEAFGNLNQSYYYHGMSGMRDRFGRPKAAVAGSFYVDYRDDDVDAEELEERRRMDRRRFDWTERDVDERRRDALHREHEHRHPHDHPHKEGEHRKGERHHVPKDGHPRGPHRGPHEDVPHRDVNHRDHHEFHGAFRHESWRRGFAAGRRTGWGCFARGCGFYGDSADFLFGGTYGYRGFGYANYGRRFAGYGYGIGVGIRTGRAEGSVGVGYRAAGLGTGYGGGYWANRSSYQRIVFRSVRPLVPACEEPVCDEPAIVPEPRIFKCTDDVPHPPLGRTFVVPEAINPPLYYLPTFDDPSATGFGGNVGGNGRCCW